MKHSVLKQETMNSLLQEQQSVLPNEKRGKKVMNTNLVLTSLVDAFSILVIYLIFNMSSAQFIQDNGMKLPQASQSTTIKKGVVVQIKNGHFLIENKKITSRKLVQTLYRIKKQTKEKGGSLIIQASKDANFAPINQVISAGAATGYNEIKFAVIKGGSQ